MSKHGGYYEQGQNQHCLIAAPQIIEQFNGKLTAGSESPIVLEGPDVTRRIVILQFRSGVKTRAFFPSPDRQNTRNLRQGSADGELVVIVGFISENEHERRLLYYPWSSCPVLP